MRAARGATRSVAFAWIDGIGTLLSGSLRLRLDRMDCGMLRRARDLLRHDVERRVGALELGRRTWISGAGIGEALALGDVVIAFGEVLHGAVVVAIRGAIGAGEIFHAIGEIGVGIVQALRVAAVAE